MAIVAKHDQVGRIEAQVGGDAGDGAGNDVMNVAGRDAAALPEAAASVEDFADDAAVAGLGGRGATAWRLARPGMRRKWTIPG